MTSTVNVQDAEIKQDTKKMSGVFLDPFLHICIREYLPSPHVMDTCCKSFKVIGYEFGEYELILGDFFLRSVHWVYARVKRPSENLKVYYFSWTQCDDELMDLLGCVNEVHLMGNFGRSIPDILKLENLVSIEDTSITAEEVPLILSQNIKSLCIDCEADPELLRTWIVALRNPRFRNVIELRVSFRDSFDLGQLCNLSGLVLLDVSFSSISDLSPLEHFKALEALDITSTRVQDLWPLASCASLKSLTMIHVRLVSDISVLVSLKSLSILSFGLCPVFDIQPLASLSSSLESLVVAEIPMIHGSCSVLSSLVHLKHLDIEQVPLVSLNFLAHCKKLEYLKLSSLEILNDSDEFWRPLSRLTQLRKLDLAHVDIPDLAFLKNMAALIDLKLGSRHAHFDALFLCRNLQFLEISGHESVDCSIFASPEAFLSLKKIRFRFCNLRRLEHLVAARPDVSIRRDACKAVTQ